MTTMRDISVAPSTDETRSLRRPRRDLPFTPASDARPLMAAHGGMLTVERLGTVPYRPAWELQDELADQRRRRRIGDRLLLLEHFPVYTIGRGGDEANLLAGPDRLRELGASSCASIAAATSPSTGRASWSPTRSSSCATRSTCAATSAAWRRPSSRPPPPSA